MYADTEQSYRGWTIDVYQSVVDGSWCADFWKPRAFIDMDNSIRRYDRRKLVIAEAKRRIDEYEART